MFAVDLYVQVVWAAEAGKENRFYKDGALASQYGVAQAAAHVDLHEDYSIGKVCRNL